MCYGCPKEGCPKEAAGKLQLCADQKSGCEIAVHAMNDIFNNDDCEGVLQIDAKNAFNSLNRSVMIHNIKIICPTIATYVSYCYSRPARIYVLGGAEILSKEGTTQGDPIAMAVYALGITPLMSTINSSFLYTSHSSDSSNTTKQVAYPDDLTGAGKLKELRQWWDLLVLHDPSIGYYVNENKTWIIVKEKHLESAGIIFKDIGIKIIKEGSKHLGATIGTQIFKNNFVKQKVEEWVAGIKVLSRIARVDPQSALCAFTHGNCF
ncbi:uncharacterized protein LOC130646916 [Hydractinia symbiolongicarpus]|uniref:uncharacterized protein LOC130646916 n=1 Tax=Hydractinia symbiolongicarpus TaxID=13093 RepID=UPI0025500416|nr:uncharacterized protein LOC130646916 [Hydractinia symbiolongicarpus]